MQEIIIRPYLKSDREAVRKIAYNTAFMGESAAAFFEDRQILEDFLTRYYLDYEPQSCFVAQANGRVIGYLLGAKDSVLAEKISRSKITPGVLIKSLLRGTILRRKTFIFLINCVKSLFKGEFKFPDFSVEYPACLHINIEEGFRNQRIGSKMIEKYLDYLGREKVKGVHFATLSAKAAHFYEKLGFELLFKSQRSYFRNILKQNINFYVFAKKLTS